VPSRFFSVTVYTLFADSATARIFCIDTFSFSSIDDSLSSQQHDKPDSSLQAFSPSNLMLPQHSDFLNPRKLRLSTPPSLTPLLVVSIFAGPRSLARGRAGSQSVYSVELLERGWTRSLWWVERWFERRWIESGKGEVLGAEFGES